MILGLQFLIPDGLHLDHTVREIIEESRENFHNKIRPGASEQHASASSEAFVFWWQLFTGTLLGLFFLSCVTHFAQYYQLTVDRNDSHKLRKRLPHATRLELASPQSGKLRLPLPTPLVKAKAVLHTEVGAKTLGSKAAPVYNIVNGADSSDAQQKVSGTLPVSEGKKNE